MRKSGFPNPFEEENMVDMTTAALLRAIHNDVCEKLSQYETRTRTHVASKLLESASGGERSIAGLTKVGSDALRHAVLTLRLER
jgi:hypothetical protein